ncbi:hypothetical protein HORIV_33980 [Vreelandella olivaria]|uniref:Thiolase N-terminal domain-containing protein n=1 Tax=Vreelandella olivaria TaxID=390919 RepID=A0ABN5WYK7_9GAMM|nr:hypothetical protein HORIV_33980 [Halomonas olivaria]
MFDTVIGSRFPNPRLAKEYGSHSMPETADNIAHDLSIGRDASDAFAARSQARYAQALASGFYDGEMFGVEVPQGRKQPPLLIDKDEHPRPQSSEDKLAKLGALFDGGVVTAGNASGLNDGAAALIVGTKGAGERGLNATGAHCRQRRCRCGSSGYGVRASARFTKGTGACRAYP